MKIAKPVKQIRESRQELIDILRKHESTKHYSSFDAFELIDLVKLVGSVISYTAPRNISSPPLTETTLAALIEHVKAAHPNAEITIHYGKQAQVTNSGAARTCSAGNG